MSLKEWKNTEINSKLMDKWGYSSKEEVLEEGYEAYRDDDDDDLEENLGADAPAGGGGGTELPDVVRLKKLLDRVKFDEYASKLMDQRSEVKPYIDMFMGWLANAPDQAVIAALRAQLGAKVSAKQKGAVPPATTGGLPAAGGGPPPTEKLDDLEEGRTATLTIDEARAVARKIFERISEERK